MGTYKVIQDIEAEDHFLGPLTLKQFIFAAIAVVCLYLGFISATRGATFLLGFFAPIGIIAVIFAVPWSKDQPTEVWLLAKLRFYLKSRKRIWDQSGMKDLVTITVPKKIERHLTDGLDQTQVHSRLKGLANTLDSRGWAVKNINVNLYTQDAQINYSDRLLNVSTIPQEVDSVDVYASDDILDEQSNPTAALLDQMITQQATTYKQALRDMVKEGVQRPDWQQNYDNVFQTPEAQTFNNSTAPAQSPTANTITPADETALLENLHKQTEAERLKNTHLLTINPLGTSPKPTTQQTSTSTVTQTTTSTSEQVRKPAIMQLARNDDLNVETIARQAKKEQELGDEEVIISLH